MNLSKKIRKLLIDADVSVKELGIRLGTSPNNISNKLSRNDMKFSDIENIANVLGYKVKLKFVKKENHLEDDTDEDED